MEEHGFGHWAELAGVEFLRSAKMHLDRGDAAEDEFGHTERNLKKAYEALADALGAYHKQLREAPVFVIADVLVRELLNRPGVYIALDAYGLLGLKSDIASRIAEIIQFREMPEPTLPLEKPPR